MGRLLPRTLLIRVSISLLVLHNALISQVQALTCPSTIGKGDPFSVAVPTTISIDKTVGVGSLCTLTLELDNGSFIPIARSYDGNDWERAGGSFIANSPEWVCSGSSCSSTIPAGNTYVLQTRSTSLTALDFNAELARFLESASFGPKPSDLTTWNGKSFAQYIKDQVRTPMTSHRELFRRLINQRWTFHKPEFAGYLDPCAPKSTWRRQILTTTDRRKLVNVRRVGDRWEVNVEGHVRAMVLQLRFIDEQSNSDTITDGGSYEFCSTEEEVRRNIFRVIINNNCRELVRDDLIVDFPLGFTPLNSIQDLLPPLEQQSEWQKISSRNPEYLLKSAIPKAQRFRLFCRPVVKFVSFGLFCRNSACKLNSPSPTTNAPLFAKTSDGIWLQHDPRINMGKNTISEPLPDGGLGLLAAKKTLHCSNVARTFFNEDKCIMSEVPACYPGSTNQSYAATGTIVCGSPGEISNDITTGDNWLDITSIDNYRSMELGLPADTVDIESVGRQREFIWSEASIKANDQLRQRIAFALLHIFSLPKLAIFGESQYTEIFLIYYDILVRNAFGNYGDILQEISYNALNAESLTYINSVSVATALRWSNAIILPDENYARELMELFTIGLVELNMDGTPVLDANGAKIQTYDKDDVASFAKVWTAFRKSTKRANAETIGNDNRYDPLRLDADLRDRFPKTDLAEGYIGDYYPLCIDLPAKAYLSIGAKYRLLGSSPIPELKIQRWTATQATKYFKLRRTGQIRPSLYNKLCDPSLTGACSYPSLVVLESNLPCNELECSVDTVQVVQVNSVFYEYVRAPCVEQSFFMNGVKISGSWGDSASICTNPLLPVASEACCFQNETLNKDAVPACLISGETMTWNTAAARCASIDRVSCDYRTVVATEKCPLTGFYWTTESCMMRIKVSSIGQAAIVHNKFIATSNTFDELQSRTPNYFKVYWKDGQYPSVKSNCGGGQCEVFEDTCICNVTVSNVPVFVTSPPANAAEILQQLRIGHPGRSTLNTKTAVSNGDYKYYGKTQIPLDQTTVFEVEDRNGQTRYLRNLKSIVTISGTVFEFRNPPQFNSIIYTEASIANAHYETEAALDHLLYHQNTPPFLARQFIQRFGESNPTPRYIKVVATAFKSGSYKDRGISFGKGKYGDLEATIAAVLLDREARSVVLDYDPAHGSLREPILKVLSFMRATDFKSSSPLVELDYMERKVGQMAYEQASVFSFFRPDYSPPELAGTGLTSPESQLLSSPSNIGLMNGLYSLIKNGLSECNGGFGAFGDCSNLSPSGNITFVPSSVNVSRELVRDLSYLLTSGRMSVEKQKTIVAEIDKQPNATYKYILALQLLTASPEFHSTSSIDPLAPAEKPPKPPSNIVPPTSDYKVVIHLMLIGGCDSFNVLVPSSNCGSLHQEYRKARGAVGLAPEQSLPLSGNARSTQQPCSSFTVHNGLSTIQKLYNDADLLFMANVGVLTQYVNRSDFYPSTRTPLLSHEAMQDEVTKLDPWRTYTGTGVFGRMTDVLQEKGYRTSRTTIDAALSNLGSRSGSASAPYIFSVSSSGMSSFNVNPSSSTMNSVIQQLNNATSGIYGNVWSTLWNRSINQENFARGEPKTVFPSTHLGGRFKIASQLIASRVSRGVDRDVFFIPFDGFDTHSAVIGQLGYFLPQLNDALSAFVTELKVLGVWDNTAIVQASDFGRSMEGNNLGGTEHGWGGNYWLAGGGVKGQRIVGKYPPTFNVDYEYNFDRGRFIPTTAWDSILNAVSQWMGVTDVKDLQRVLPNRDKFPDLFASSMLFI